MAIPPIPIPRSARPLPGMAPTMPTAQATPGPFDAVMSFLHTNSPSLREGFAGMVGAGDDSRDALTGFTKGLQHGKSAQDEAMIVQQEQAAEQAKVQAEQEKQQQQIAWLQQNAPEYADLAAQGIMTPGDAAKAWLESKKSAEAPKPTASIQEYNLARQQGYTGTFADYEKELRAAGATNIDFNQNQGVAAGFADRMQAANQVLDDPKLLAAMTDITKPALAGVPGVGNFMVGPEYQQAEQAQRDFVNAILRRESGAAIAPSEFENAKKQYFPQPGDSPEVIKQKAQNRQIAIQGVVRAAGANYTPPSLTPPGVTDPLGLR